MLVAVCVLAAGVIIFAIFSCNIQKLWRQRFLYKESSKFPGPSTLPILGNAHLFRGSTEDIMNRFIELGKLYGSPYRLWFGSFLVFVVNTPEQIKIVCQSQKTIDRGDFYSFAKPWLGQGLLSGSGARWQKHRKLIQPTFSSMILKSFVGVFSGRSKIMAKEMERHLDGPEFDVYNYIAQLTLHTICETTMGVNLEERTKENIYYSEATKQVVGRLCRRTVSPWLHPDFIFNRTQLGRNQQRDIKFLHNFTDKVIQTKKKELLEKSHRPGSAENQLDGVHGMPKKKVLLDHLIELSRDSEKMTDEEIREEVDTMMVAGSDTTAITSSFLMLMLASYPEVQEKVYEELCEIYGDDDSDELHVTPEDLTRMSYLERVIKETMRLFPITPLLTRSVTDNLDIGEHTLPAGSLVFLSTIDVHRNGDIWPDPLNFDPDRFLPEEVAKRDSYAYIPFSAGPRNCIGSKYAMMSMKTLSAIVLRRYVLKKDDITPAKDIRIKWKFLLRAVDPIALRIERRTRRKAASAPEGNDNSMYRGTYSFGD